MTKLELPPDILNGFHCNDVEETLGKLALFASSGPRGLHVVSDFDLTLTAGKRPGQNLGTWDVMDALMPPEGVRRHTAIYSSFRPLELAGRLTNEIAQAKWSETLDLITSYHMDIGEIKTAFLSVAMLRDGAKELFDRCERYDVPTVILSSGIRNVIQLMAEHYGIRPDHILSNDLEVDDTGHVSGWRRATLIHMLNKHEMGHSELSRLRSKRPNVVLLGDVGDDTKMVAGNDVLRIRVLDPREGEAYDLEAALGSSFDAGYDLAVEHSLQPVVHLVEWLSSQPARQQP